jgi:transposase
MALGGRGRGEAGPIPAGRASLRGRLSRVALAVLIWSAYDASPASDLPTNDGGVRRVRPLDLAVRVSLGRALHNAAAKLERARCHEVFSDFRDGSGRSLRENLDATGLDGPAHLRSLTFSDGRPYDDCRLPNVLALASPGRGVIHICGPQFLQRERLDPGFMAALLIHEQLHTLGLGENPPHSQEITARVIARCGR